MVPQAVGEDVFTFYTSATRFFGKINFGQNFSVFPGVEVKILLQKSSPAYFLLSESADITFKIKVRIKQGV